MKPKYDVLRRNVKEQELKNKLSDTLLTKILMGTLDCVPAYDRYFIDGVKKSKVATGRYNIKSLLMLADFYEANEDRFEKARLNMDVCGEPYP